MSSLIDNVQDRFKSTSHAVALLALKALSGAVLGLTLALIFQEIIQYGVLSFILVTVVVTGSILRISKTWSWTHILIFDLICVLIALLLRMYILIAPGA